MPEALAAYRTCAMDAACANVPDDEGGSPDFLKGRLLSDGRASNGCAQNSKKNACVWHMPENYISRWYKAETPANVPPAEDTLRLESCSASWRWQIPLSRSFSYQS